MADIWKKEAPSNILVLVASQEEKVSLMVQVDEQGLEAGLKAGNLIKPLAAIVGGGGGGKPQMAQAGGKKPAAIPELLAQVSTIISEQL